MRHLNSWIAAIAVVGMTAGLNHSQAGNQTKNEGAKSRAEKQDEMHVPYMGVAVARLHPAFASQMPKTLAKGQGVLVERVAEGSPAGKAGLKQHDILTKYDDQKLFSVEQLLHLIRADKTGREVTLQFVREGKLMTADIKLGEHPVESHLMTEFEHWVQDEFSPFHVSHKPHEASKDQSSDWESFDSMSLTKLKNGRYRAQLKYLGKDRKIHELKYEGSREELRNKINHDTELRETERNHLLRSLDLKDEIEIDVPTVQMIPGRGVLIEIPQSDL